jgi:SAM-dependent methyltransferase
VPQAQTGGRLTCPTVTDASSRPVFENSGYCPCCRARTVFQAFAPWLRDYYACSRCGSIPRQRHVVAVLDARFPSWEDCIVHESSPSGDFIARHARHYSDSQYVPDTPRGGFRGGVRSEDIEALTFPDESIDIFITQDVLEHVFHPEVAIREVHRVLRPGGAHVFTTPKHQGLLETVQRARLGPDGVIQHILEAQYHNNPIGDGALVTYDYGSDFERLLSRWAGTSVEVFHTVDRSRGIDAAFNEVFVIAKPSRPWTGSRRYRAPAVQSIRRRVGRAGQELAHGVRRTAKTAFAQHSKHG